MTRDEDRPEEEVRAAPAPLGAGLPPTFGGAAEHLEDLARAAAGRVVVGTAGGGAVEIRMNGDLEPLGVKIDRSIVEQGDVALLEDLVLAALRQALLEAVALREQAVADMLPSFDVGSLVQNLLGGGGAGPGGGDLAELFGGLFGGASPEEGDDEPDDGTPEPV